MNWLRSKCSVILGTVKLVAWMGEDAGNPQVPEFSSG